MPFSSSLVANTAYEITGFGNVIGGIRTGCFGSHKVSLSFVWASFAKAPMSPAIKSSTTSCFFPFKMYKVPTFSVALFLLAFITVSPLLIFPERTLNMRRLPT